MRKILSSGQRSTKQADCVTFTIGEGKNGWSNGKQEEMKALGSLVWRMRFNEIFNALPSL